MLGDIVTIMYQTEQRCDKIARLHRICSVFYRVAKAYIETRLAKVTRRAAEASNDRGDVDINAVTMARSSAEDVLNWKSSLGVGELIDVNSDQSTGMRTAPDSNITSGAALNADNNGHYCMTTGATSHGKIACGAEGLYSESCVYGSGITLNNPNRVGRIGSNLDANLNANLTVPFASASGPSASFLDGSAPSLSMMEMGEEPTFDWLPTGQDMVGFLDTDMGMFDI